MQMRLVKYSETPQVTALEYSEMRDLQENPQKKDYYKSVVKSRLYIDSKRRRKISSAN